MNGSHDGQHELKLVDGSGYVAIETEAEDLEQYLQVIKNGEANLKLLLKLEKILPRLLIWSVLEAYASCDNGIGQSHYNDQDMVYWTLKELEAKSWSKPSVSILMNSHQLPSFVVSLEDLSAPLTIQILCFVNPHLLKLDSDLIESLCDDSNEHIFHHPSQEEDHCCEVKSGLPVLS